MNNITIDIAGMLDTAVEGTLMQNEETRPIADLLKRYGIVGLKAVSFIAELGTVVQLMEQAENK